MSAGSNLTPVNKNEWLARYIYSSNCYRKIDGTVNHRAFLPNPNTNNLSVIRHNGFSETDLLQIGKKGAILRSSNFHGRADIRALIVYEQGLLIKPTEEPLNHANIIGWPSAKDEQMEIAVELASKAQFVRYVG